MVVKGLTSQIYINYYSIGAFVNITHRPPPPHDQLLAGLQPKCVRTIPPQAGSAAVPRAVGERAAGGAQGVRQACAAGGGRSHQLHTRPLHDRGHGTQAREEFYGVVRNKIIFAGG